MSNHSPGPFHWHDRFGRKDGVGPTAPGKNILGEDPPVGQCSHDSYVVSDDQGFVVARCSNALVTMSSERSEANARLLAASLQMLDALQSVLLYETYRLATMVEEPIPWQRARNAIKAAVEAS